MDFRERFTGLSSSGWFLIIFILLMVGGVGYALGTQTAENDQRTAPKRFHNNKRLLPEDGQTKRPLQGNTANPQDAGPSYDAPMNNNPQGTPTQPYGGDNPSDLPPNPDPGGCKPYQPTVDRNCLDRF